MATTLLYNAVMFAVDVAVLCALQGERTVTTAGILAVVAATIGNLAALCLPTIASARIRLAAWAIFAHGVVLSVGTAPMFWQSRRGWSLAAGVVAVGLRS